VEGSLERRGAGLYDVMDGIGAHEIFIETPEHIANTASLDEAQIVLLLQAYVGRIADLSRDHRLRYVLIFKNYGHAAGGGPIQHARSQLIATPVTPKRVKEKLLSARRYFEYKERCLFCDIIKQELDSGERVVLDHPDFLVLTPFASRFPFELCLLPKEHSPDFGSLSRERVATLASVLKATLGRLSAALGDPPYNYILHTAPFRTTKKAGYWKTLDDDYHWHVEIMPRLIRVAGFEWGTGFYINPTPPEEAARYLREAGPSTSAAAPAAAGGGAPHA
jgi:UDPglucose--hexose-1-phosphate uridylyltransferase